MTADILVEQALQLPPAEREQLCERIWATLDGSTAALSPAHAEELERRLAHYEAQPDDVIPWDDLKAEILEKRGLKL